MWKKYKKEIIAGGLVIAILSFALGCAFNSSTQRSGAHAQARIEQRADQGMPGQNPDQEFGMDNDGRDHHGKGHGYGHSGMCKPGCDGQQPSAENRPGDNNGQIQSPPQQPGGNNSQDQTKPQAPDSNNSQNQTQPQTEDKAGDQNNTTQNNK